MTVLEQLIHPLGAAEFMATRQGRTYLHQHIGLEAVRALLGESVGSEAFLAELASPAYVGREVTATFFHGRFYGPTEVKPRSFDVAPKQSETAYRAGHSVIGDLINPEAIRVAAHLRRDMNHAGEVMIAGSMSPGGGAFHAHIDPVDSFKIQIEGSKTWFLSREPIVRAPRQGAFLREDATLGYPGAAVDAWEQLDGLDLDGLIEIVLRPGDVLYVPPGMVHATHAEGHSYSVDVGFSPYPPMRFLDRVLEPMLRRDVNWRHLPASIARDGGLPPEIRAHLADRIAELRAALDAIDLDGPEVNRAWKQLIAQPDVETGAALAAGRVPSDAAVAPSDLLAVSPYAPVTHAWHGESIDVYQADTHLSVPGAGAEFLRGVLEAGRFEAAAAARFTGGEPAPWEDVQPYLTMLVRQGLLEPAR